MYLCLNSVEQTVMSKKQFWLIRFTPLVNLEVISTTSVLMNTNKSFPGVIEKC